MKQIGLIEIEDNDYKYYAYNKGNTYCKTYRYYYENELLFKAYCKEHSISKKVIDNRYNGAKTQDIELFDKKGVKISSALHLLKPENYSKDHFEKYLNAVIHENYPVLAYYENLAFYINDTFY